MRRRNDPVSNAFEIAAAAQAAALTICLRTMRWQSAALGGRSFADPENQVMVTEKAKAAVDGYAAGLAALARLALVWPFNPCAVAARANEAAMAPFRPAMRRARANAKRLSRPRTRR